MYVLGVSAFYHDAAAALLRDGHLVAAAQEERFSRVKYDHRFPSAAIAYCLRRAGITPGELAFVAFYEKPLAKFERILMTQLATFPASSRLFREAMIAWWGEKLWLKTRIASELSIPPDRILFVEHHLSHAASAVFCAPFVHAAVLTVDGVGEWTTASLGRSSADWGGGTNKISLTDEMRFPHSLGLLYSAFTAWLGFKVNSGEYKVMGMAAYGSPRYLDRVAKVIRVFDDGSFELNLEYFAFQQSLREAYSARFVDLFGPPRPAERPFFTSVTDPGARSAREAEENQYYADVAASVQRVTEEVLLSMASRVHRQTGLRQLAMAGGVALNSVANGRLVREGPFQEIFVQPNAGDAGGALGAALYIWHVLLGKPRQFVLHHCYYGEEYSADQIRRALGAGGAVAELVEEEGRLLDRVVGLLAGGKVVGLFRGRFEWGPRALGNRSILADPRSAAMKDLVNTKVKFREPFRPFAPAVPVEASHAYFDLRGAGSQFPARFMLLVVPVNPGRAADIPAVTHAGTARLQTVHGEWNPFFHDLLQRFGQATGVPVLLNTSFNLRGEPIVASPSDALASFMRSDLDALVMGPFLLEKGARAAARAVPVAAARRATAAAASAPGVLCPVCGGALAREPAGRWRCTSCAQEYGEEAGIPLLFWPTGEGDVDRITELVRSFYEDNPFPNYDDLDTPARLVAQAGRSIFAQMLDEQIPDTARVVDVGCGTGQLTNFLALRGRTVIGTDICLNSLKLGMAFRNRHQIDSAHFIQMNLFRPVLPSRAFDVVICNGVLHHTDDPFQGFRAIADLVRPGGHIIVGLYHRYARVWTDLRRAVFRLTGGRAIALDPYLRRSEVGDGKKQAWYVDQYQHPHETRHTLDEVVSWLAATGFTFVTSIPKPVPFAGLGRLESLFRPQPLGSRMSRLAAQVLAVPGGRREGGLFVTIGRRATQA